ncbi:G-type lectin S-receptor-like serine/threonine-protein kinase At4g27290 isoform X2 [Sorghum bicolor]|uniref:G-type lectin S-receptor-like serine/threonine-protein kinase At4g27290 isoform X2 n=1 Tax=Sorghum bicolor TaxID=4558 RepID=UPI000B426B3B|nr:G-type lectin S-receptor-like serine/threonine-protein kinase At4g27290 isoform X2 [Sorghum bicolor]|eukprot:XP_021312353.1 G-type lectin S-receptor-like serine/threonine-protein kinase At4g27290 isoform X2 [Sorghum bicolor]
MFMMLEISARTIFPHGTPHHTIPSHPQDSDCRKYFTCLGEFREIAMFGKISFWRNCMLVDLLILSVLATRCLSDLTARTDIIFQNQSISDGQTLVSMGKEFVLGFFSPGASSNRYVGIWHNDVSERRAVWVANRNNPFQDTFGILKFDNNSNLIVLDGRGNSFTVAYGRGVQDVEAAILDNGNFVLRSIRNQAKIIWQSFDFPTDTWLPEMNIILGSKLTSWKSYDDPAVGDYSFGLDVTNALQLIILWKGNNYWTFGPWNATLKSLIPELKYIPVTPVSFQCGNLTCTYTSNPSDTMAKIVLDPNGSLNIAQFSPGTESWTLLWRQPASCEVSNLCGGFGICNNNMLTNDPMSSLCRCPKGFAQQDIITGNTWKGCTRQIQLQCNGDRFMNMSSMRLPDSRVKLSTMGENKCQLECMTNCSCTAYTYSVLDGCSLWYGNLTNMQDGYNGSGVGTLYLRVAASELESSNSSGHKLLWMAGVLPSVGFLIFCLILFIWIRRSKNKGKGKQDGHHSVMTSDAIKLWEGEETSSYFATFSFSQIRNATDKFSTENMLGEGGFGPVYKGHLPDGREIAVKRLAANSGQGLPEFKNEVLLIARLQHTNLVRLLGCCIEEEEMLLVYEYMPNKSLDFFLFEKSRRALLDWEMRMNIIEGVAQGLIYLHKHSRLRIIHRDLKASNILLDTDMNPKISDFGMARIFDPKGTQANTKRVVGTYGYMAPEYAMAGNFSTKSDVFSYGVLLLEIISGMKNAGSRRHGNSVSLLGYAWELWNEGRCHELIDKPLHGRCPENVALRCIHVSLLCVQEQAADRPSMTEVISMITNGSAILPDPKQPGFLSMLVPNETDIAEETCSLNGLSVTILDGR